MYHEEKIAVVMPAFNEEKLIVRTIVSVPEYIDHIVVIDDGSRDRTADAVDDMRRDDKRIVLIRHEKNKGCGAARTSGYKWCRDNDIDIAIGIDADGQMDPDDIPALIEPIIEGKVDFTKGNRLITGQAWKKIPHIRYLGNSILTFLTKIASGYWHITDSQSGFNAMNKRVLKMLPFDRIYSRYGWPNDLLVMLNIYSFRAMDVPVNPIYGVGEKSGIKLRKAIFTLSFLMLRLFLRRMIQKYIIRDFHPLVLFYVFGGFLLLLDVPLVIRLFVLRYQNGYFPPTTALTILFCTFIGFQSILFAMLFDMEANKELKEK